MNRSVIHS